MFIVDGLKTLAHFLDWVGFEWVLHETYLFLRFLVWG